MRLERQVDNPEMDQSGYDNLVFDKNGISNK